ncbi:thioredoxin family protein [Persicimonas caeni]|uniref:Thioredoxin family protein n=1 Tax=Persicimonas caeni TaxID=2292766 RepID=A0A4Y6PUA4_PERCE|nr:thioredoxin family protein [Persicimonas caeni]QDG51820.1 thioredoxin family protein [Persicimonas caeni]QED33041.1 thioredoxin family protein [Persicimonas caeni]
MALIESHDAQLGMDAPDFELSATDGQSYSLESFADADVLVMMFICNHCPYVKAVRGRLVDLAEQMSDQSVAFAAISSNDAERYPDDGFERMKEVAEEYNFPFPYLYDETQDVARSYGAVCTPDFFVFDEDRKLRYRGRLDDNWKEPEQVSRRELKAAVDTLLAGETPDEEQHPSMGCSIKWKQ